MATSLDVIVLAAGLGTRMKSPRPKVLHEVCGEPILKLLLTSLDETLAKRGEARFNIVVGHGRKEVQALVQSLIAKKLVQTPVIFTTQEEQRGTGHAVMEALKQSASAHTIAVVNGDLPLFTASVFEELMRVHVKEKSVATLAAMKLMNPAQYGRVIRKGKQFIKIVEHKDATAKELKACEVNGGVYVFDRKFLQEALKKLGTSNKAREYYLPQILEIGRGLHKKVFAHVVTDSAALLGVNTMEELAEVQRHLYLRVSHRHMQNGVCIHDPTLTYIGPFVTLGAGTTLMPFTFLLGQTHVGARVQIGAHCSLKDVVVGDDSLMRQGTVAEDAQIGHGCTVGPMAHLRPGTVLGHDVRVGNFVEIKASQINAHTNAAHLSYIGDAEIGSHVNLGCGFITCNYDGTVKEGKRKHPTVIGDNVFVGSDTQVVAPIHIAKGSYIASGSTVTKSVEEPESLVIARSRQVTKPGYARKYRKQEK